MYAGTFAHVKLKSRLILKAAESASIFVYSLKFLNPHLSFLSCSNRSQEQAPRNMQKEIEDIQQPLMELVVAPSVESRPSTPPPQPGNRTREMPLSVCRLPVRKGANLVRKPLRPVRRRLFDPPSPAEVEDFLSGLEQRDQRRFIDRFEILILLTLPFLTDIF